MTASGRPAFERAGLWLLHRLEPERAHSLSLWALRLGLAPLPAPVTSPRLAQRLAGLDLPNPVGLAAGYDKNAVAIAPLLRAGFGFVELGAVTPRAQPGNPRPRLFRLPADRAVINRFGFNNEGAARISARLRARPARGIVGLNLGANKDSHDRAADYVSVLTQLGPLVDFVTVNVSSPNTRALRDLQQGAALSDLLSRVLSARERLASPLPVFLKIAPDLDLPALDAIATISRAQRLDALIATNTTVARPTLSGRFATESGGLSGAPLFAPSTRILALLAQRLEGQVPLIGVGGISSPEDAYAKIRAGAAAVQIYTGLVYRGLSLVAEINRGLERLLAADGFSHVSEAVGLDRDRVAGQG